MSYPPQTLLGTHNKTKSLFTNTKFFVKVIIVSANDLTNTELVPFLKLKDMNNRDLYDYQQKIIRKVESRGEGGKFKTAVLIEIPEQSSEHNLYCRSSNGINAFINKTTKNINWDVKEFAASKRRLIVTLKDKESSYKFTTPILSLSKDSLYKTFCDLMETKEKIQEFFNYTCSFFEESTFREKKRRSLQNKDKVEVDTISPQDIITAEIATISLPDRRIEYITNEFISTLYKSKQTYS